MGSKVVSDQEVFDCPDLYSTQEETDTRMILQALHADKRLKELGKQGRIIIKTTVLNTTNVSHLDPQFTVVGHLLIKINTENNHICIRGFDNDPALLSQFFEPKKTLINFFGDFIVKFNQSNPLVSPGNLYYIAGSFGNPKIVKVVSDQEVFDCPDL
jgi:hypothetical protein